MTRNLNKIGLVLLLAVISLTAFKCNKKPQSPSDGITFPSGVHLPGTPRYAVNTPGGVLVISDVTVPADALTAIDEGITNQITRINAAWPGWTVGANLNEYKVFFIDPTATNQDGSPAILVYGIQSAGTTIGVANDGFPYSVLVLPHQQATNWRYRDYLMRSAWHESEHDREWHNNQGVFYYFVQPGMDVHPHFP